MKTIILEVVMVGGVPNSEEEEGFAVRLYSPASYILPSTLVCERRGGNSGVWGVFKAGKINSEVVVNKQA